MKWHWSEKVPKPAAEYLEAMAAVREMTVPDFLHSLMVADPEPKHIKCEKCGQLQTQHGAVFPEPLPNYPRGTSPFRTTIAIRIFVNKWVEARIGDKLTYTCSECTTMSLKPAIWMMEKFFPADEQDEDVKAVVEKAEAKTGLMSTIRDLFGGGGSSETLISDEKPKALPAPGEPREK